MNIAKYFLYIPCKYSIVKQVLDINFDIYEGISYLQDSEKLLFEKASQARKVAYAPYSKFLVGCAILLDNGEIVSGNNQENVAYPSGLCAERTTIFWLSANYPNQIIKKIFVVGGHENEKIGNHSPTPPCGACRQSILEYEVKQKYPIEIYFSSTNGKIIKCGSIKDLLPFSFDKNFL